MPRWIDASEDEIDACNEVHPILVIAYPRGHAVCERILLRAELRPCIRHPFQKLGSVEPPRSRKLPIGCVLPADSRSVSRHGAHRRPLLLVRHAKSANLLAKVYWIPGTPSARSAA